LRKPIIKKVLLTSTSLFLTTLLVACGGGGSGGGSSSSTAAPANVSAAGVWTGIARPSGYELDLIVMPNNTLYSLFGTPISGGLSVLGVDFGSVTSSGSSYTGSFKEYYYNNTSTT
jgi:hypothetical protein